MRKMTTQESEFAAKTIHILDKFVEENGLTDPDSYDRAVSGFLNAVQIYLSQSDFPTLAYSKMKSACMEQPQSAEKNPLISLSSRIAAEMAIEDDSIMAIEIREAVQTLDRLEQEILSLLSAGYSHNTIIQLLGLSRQGLSEHLTNIQAVFAA